MGKQLLSFMMDKLIKNHEKERYSIDDLMSQIRDKDLCSPEEVAFAILENNGNLSVLPKKTCKVRHPDPLISDGKINKEALIEIEKDEEWLKKNFKKEGVNGIEEVFLCLWQKSGMYVIKENLRIHPLKGNTYELHACT